MTRQRETRYPRRVAARVSAETADRLNAIADAEGVMLGAVVRDAIERGIASAEKAASGRRSGATRRGE